LPQREKRTAVWEKAPPTLVNCPKVNPERRVCSCGAVCDDGGYVCAACGSNLASPTDTDAAFPPGTILGSYRLVRQIGSGGMGRVFIAEHTRLGRQVALKLLRSEYSGNREAVKRFFAEARAVNRINHENIIEVSDFIESPEGAYYIMELLKGVDLRTLEDRARGPLPLARSLRIALQVCAGLGAAHRAGIVHRDLKPDNIFLTDRSGRTDFVKLLDFGVAKLMDAALDEASMVKSTAGVVVGTPDYMSPEQAIGEAVDARSDIYALGVILFEMIASQRPFEAQSAREIMVKHLVTPPPRPTKLRHLPETIPPALEQLILGCLKKNPVDRPQSVQEVERWLQRILDGLPPLSDAGLIPVSRWTRLTRDRRVWWGGVGAAVIIAGTLALVAAGRASPPAGAVGEIPAPPMIGAVASHAAGPKPAADVEVTFESTPEGATVFRAGSETPLGLTPFVARMAVAAEPQIFEFRRTGWKAAQKSVTLMSNATVELALMPNDGTETVGGEARTRKKRERPTPETSARGERRKNVKLDQSSVLNPFE
jgi:serine/threonine protein kinase